MTFCLKNGKMITYLITFFVFVCIGKANIEIKDTGIGFINNGDIAIIFYLTVENICEKDLEISVNMIQCCETLSNNENDCNGMYLVGGNMGILAKRLTKNVTLVYPNLYLFNRHGVCNIAVNYQNDNTVKTITKEVEFKTNETSEEKNQCSSMDLDPLQGCSPVDCAIKYSGEKSYFNPNSFECQYVPRCTTDPNKCLPEIAYSIANNNCTNLNCSLNKRDLELLENNQVDAFEGDNTVVGNVICHHGDLDNSGQCQCLPEWITALDEEDVYEPSLLQYNMCNIEKGAWNDVNRSKIKTTSLIITIFAITIASKILILMCVLNFCYKHFKSSKKEVCTDQTDKYDESLIICPDQDLYADKCICEELPKRTLQSETVNVSYYHAAPSIISVPQKKYSIKKLVSSDHTAIVLSHTTTSAPISFQGDTECTCTTDNSSSEEEDYEIEFTGEEEEEDCICLQEDTNLESIGEPSEQSEYTTSIAGDSKKSSSQRTRSSSKKSSVTLPRGEELGEG